VEGDLAALWRDVGRDARIARAVMSNLVVYRRRRDSERRAVDILQTDAAIEAVVARHPSRVVLVEHDARGQQATTVTASVGVALFGPQTARYAVDQVAVRSACVETSLPSIVRRFIRGDLPTSIWWNEDLSTVPALEALIAVGRQLVYDSRHWQDVRRGVETIASLVASQRIDLADLNWRRLAPLRQALVHVAPSLGDTVSAFHVRIHHRSDEALAWLLAGWLCARLEWASGIWPAIDETPHDDEILTLAVGAGSTALTISMNDHRVVVSVPGATPFTIRVPQVDEAEAVAVELRSLSHDSGLHDALAALARQAPG